MAATCFYTGKKNSRGMKRRWRGQAISKGGFGLKPTGINRRTFRVNLQEVTAIVGGAPMRVRASAKAIKQGLVVKPLKRKYGYTRQQKAAAQR
jgi:large subunit ribosomal protein L28